VKHLQKRDGDVRQRNRNVDHAPGCGTIQSLLQLAELPHRKAPSA
jgi:hypothetical protein